MKSPDSHRIFGPDLIRATAIVFVLLAHSLPGGHASRIIQQIKFLLGYFGVEIFFVLSGYLIGGILMRELFEGRFNSMKGVTLFWKRRWFRTLPNFYLFFFLILALDRIRDGSFPLHWKSSLIFSQSLISHPPDFFTAAWSLAVEEWFYLLFPMALFGFALLFSTSRRAVIASMVCFLVVPAILRIFIPSMTHGAIDGNGGIRLVTWLRLDAITYGVLLIFIQQNHRQIWGLLQKFWALGAIGTLAIFIYGCWDLLQHDEFFDANSAFWRVFYFCLTSVCLMLTFPKVAMLKAPQGWWVAIVRNMSLWSYSIYLSHVFFGELITLIFNRFGWSVYGVNAVAVSALLWTTSIPCSAMVYRFFEKPVMDLRDKPLKLLPWRSRLSAFDKD